VIEPLLRDPRAEFVVTATAMAVGVVAIAIVTPSLGRVARTLDVGPVTHPTVQSQTSEMANAMVGGIPIGSFGSLLSITQNTNLDRHHVVQDVDAKELPGYSRSKAPAIGLRGPSYDPTSPHGRVTQAQQAWNTTMGRPATLGQALAKANVALKAEPAINPSARNEAMNRARGYFFNDLGLEPDTPLRSSNSNSDSKSSSDSEQQ